MKGFFVLAALASAALAQFDTNSQPFRLVIKSDNATLDGMSLGACHEGAATESLCPYASNETVSFNTFYHQTQSSPTFSPPDDDAWGILTWNLTYNHNQTQPSAMRLIPDLNTNVAIPIILPGNETYTAVSFTSGGCMYLERNQDDTISPPAPLNPPEKVENWYVCLTRYSYLYETLAWKIGKVGEPQNPSCQKVTVMREFV